MNDYSSEKKKQELSNAHLFYNSYTKVITVNDKGDT